MQLTPAFIDDPYPLYAQLLAGPRMLWTGLWDGAWLVARYADVIEVLRSPGLSAQRADHFTTTLDEATLARFRPYLEAFSRWMLFENPPRHTEIRRPLNRGFTPTALTAWRPLIERTAAELCDAAIAAGEVDFIEAIAGPFPARIITEMLGLDPAMTSALLKWSDDVAALFGSPVFVPELAEAAQAGLLAIHDYIRSVLPERRKRRGDDLLSLLVGLEDEGVVDEESLLSQASNLLFGGHETVRRALGNGLHALLTRPDQWAKLCADPAGNVARTVREVLRYDSPVQVSMRVTEAPMTLLDQELGAGQKIAVLIGAGNRDPRKFSDPDRFDIGRDEGAPLTFGYGPHACVGAAMGRMEMEIFFATLAAKAPGVTLADRDPPHIQNPVFRSFARLPVRF